jgi:glycogen synthase
VRDGENGFLVEPGDPRTLADAIATLLECGDLRRRMGERNLALIRAQFSVQHVVDAHAAVYEDVLSAPD